MPTFGSYRQRQILCWKAYRHIFRHVGHGDVALLVPVDGVEPLHVFRHLLLGQVDGNVFAGGAVHVLAHLCLQEVEGLV